MRNVRRKFSYIVRWDCVILSWVFESPDKKPIGNFVIWGKLFHYVQKLFRSVLTVTTKFVYDICHGKDKCIIQQCRQALRLCFVRPAFVSSLTRIESYTYTLLCSLIKYEVRMMTNNDNVESSLLTSNLLKICSLYNFCYKLHKSCSSSRVVSSMKCVLQVVRHTEHIALYRTIVYC